LPGCRVAAELERPIGPNQGYFSPALDQVKPDAALGQGT